MKFQLLTIAICLLAITACSTTKTNKEKEALFTAPIGVQAYSFRNYFPKDIPGTLDRIQAMGIKEIEGDGGKLPPEEYKKLCEVRGISIPSTGASFKELANEPMAIVEKAKALGAKYVMCAWIDHEFGHFGLADADKAIAVFNAAGKVLADNDLTFCYHPHGYEFIAHEEGTLLDYIIQKTNPSYVSFEMDTYWIQFGGGDPVAMLKKYRQRWKLLHLKDMQKGTEKNLTGNGDIETNVPLGTGEIDMVGILKEAQKIGIAHYFIEDESSAVMNQVPRSVAYLRGLKVE